jgi:hypothetical protein
MHRLLAVILIDDQRALIDEPTGTPEPFDF